MSEGSKPKLLFLCQTLPYPPDGGVEIRTFNVLRLLSRAFDITLLCFFRRATRRTEEEVQASVRGLGEVGHVEAFKIPQEHNRVRLVWDHLRSVAFRRVYTRDAYDSREFRDRLRWWLEEDRFDLVHVDNPDLSGYLPDLVHAPVVLTHHNVESDLLRRRAAGATSRLLSRYLEHQADLMEAEERKWCPRVALNVTVSEADATRLEEIAPGCETFVLPNGVDTQAFRQSEEEGHGLVFVGGANWLPNRDAMDYFGEAILPLVREQRPNLEVTWVGRAEPSMAKHFEERYGIRLTGYVETIQPHVHGAAAYVVPLRVGGGSRLKILDAWAMGKAVVSTSVGCEGLEAVDGENILIRDDPTDFARAVESVLDDAEFRARLGAGARRIAVSRYDWEVLGVDLISRYREILHQ